MEAGILQEQLIAGNMEFKQNKFLHAEKQIVTANQNINTVELCVDDDYILFKHVMASGGFGSVYTGRLKDGQRIAVKQHKHASLQGEKEFRSEVNVLSKARRKNVVMLLGSCSECRNRLLVYEYICNGSLDIHLSRNNPNVLSWKNRVEIALGVARGLNYLHQKNIIQRYEA